MRGSVIKREGMRRCNAERVRRWEGKTLKKFGSGFQLNASVFKRLPLLNSNPIKHQHSSNTEAHTQ